MNKILCVFMSLLVFTILISGCNKQVHKTTPAVVTLLKTVLDEQAQPAVKALFNYSYNPTDSRLLNTDEFKVWIEKFNIPLGSVDEVVNKMIENNTAIGLLIPNVNKDKEVNTPDVVYFLFPPVFRVRRIGAFIFAGESMCPDGQQSCENSTGCSGEDPDSGLIKDCVTTLSCPPCSPCSPCG